MNHEQLVNLPIEWKRGSGLNKSDLKEDGVNKCILYGELYTKHKKLLITSSNISRTNQIGTIVSKKGDILIPGTSTASKKDMLLAREIDEDGVFLGGDINIIRPSKGLFAKKYLPYYFETLSAYDQLDKYITGATGIIHISNTGIKNLKVPLPSIKEQQRIVSILDKAFDAIEKAKANAEQNLKNAKELFESFLQKVFENKGEGWKENTLEELVDETCTLSYGIVQPGDEYDDGLPVIRPTDLTRRYIDLQGLKKIDPKLADSYKRTKLIGDELLLCVRGTTGVVSIATKELKDANVTRGIVPIRFNHKHINQEFGYYLLISNYVQKQIKSKTYGTALMQINIGDLRKINTPYPSLTDQKSIVSKLELLFSETKKLELIYSKKIKEFEELKMSILQKAFCGELSTAKTPL